MNYVKFYKYTKNELLLLAQKRRITYKELNKYYKPTDLQFNKKLVSLNGISQVFAQLCMHAQNRQRLNNIIKFDNNFDYIKELTCEFNPKKFIKTYKNKSNVLQKVREDKIIKWDSSNNLRHKQDVLIKQYIKSIFNGAKYLSNFNCKKEVVDDIFCVYSDDIKRKKRKNIKITIRERVNSTNRMIDYLSSKNSNEIFGYALSCDFIKELDKKFDFICKPDIHIKDTLEVLENRKVNDKQAQFIMQNIVDNVNSISNSKKEKISCYKLDRMIWLICSDNFFLHDVKETKNKYLSGIK